MTFVPLFIFSQFTKCSRKNVIWWNAAEFNEARNLFWNCRLRTLAKETHLTPTLRVIKLIILDFRIIYPLGRPTVTAGRDNCFRTCCPYVPTFQNKTNFKQKQCLLLARLWVWSSGSLMTPVLSLLLSSTIKNDLNKTFCWSTRPFHSHSQYWSLFSHMSIHPSYFSQPRKKPNFKVRIVIGTGGTVCLAEWINDSTHVLLFVFLDKRLFFGITNTTDMTFLMIFWYKPWQVKVVFTLICMILQS